MIELFKNCTKCNLLKPYSEYRKQSACKDGLQRECKSCMDERAKKRYKESKDKIIQVVIKWRKENKDKCNTHMRNYRHTNFGRARHRTYENLKRFFKRGKDHHFNSHIGLTLGEFKVYIASKFQEGMSWDNYGEWELDHIKPLSSFNLLEPEERKRANHYTNIQPLWTKDNQRKRNT